jgi:hypothetical protein
VGEVGTDVDEVHQRRSDGCHGTECTSVAVVHIGSPARLSCRLMGLFVLALAPTCASGPVTPPDLPSDITAKDLRDSAVDRLAWLSGTWVFESDEGVEEEHWSSPRGGMLLGHNRTVRAGRTVHFEFLRIEQREHGIVYVAAPS